MRPSVTVRPNSKAAALCRHRATGALSAPRRRVTVPPAELGPCRGRSCLTPRPSQLARSRSLVAPTRRRAFRPPPRVMYRRTSSMQIVFHKLVINKRLRARRRRRAAEPWRPSARTTCARVPARRCTAAPLSAAAAALLSTMIVAGGFKESGFLCKVLPTMIVAALSSIASPPPGPQEGEELFGDAVFWASSFINPPRRRSCIEGPLVGGAWRLQPQALVATPWIGPSCTSAPATSQP